MLANHVVANAAEILETTHAAVRELGLSDPDSFEHVLRR